MQKEAFNSIIFFAFFVLYTLSCTDKKDPMFLSEINGSLVNSTKQLRENSQLVYLTLEEKINNPVTKEKAGEWSRKSDNVVQLVLNVFGTIDHFKNDLKDSNIDPRSDDLYDSLKIFEEKVIAIDPEIRVKFANFIRQLTNVSKQQFLETIVTPLSRQQTLTLLNKFQNDIAIIEYKLVNFCAEQVGSGRDLGYDTFGVLVGQNTNHLRIGDDLTISAGVGAYSAKASPTFILDGKILKANENGLLQYTFKPIGQPGKYSIPLTIAFNDVKKVARKVTVAMEYTIDR